MIKEKRRTVKETIQDLEKNGEVIRCIEDPIFKSIFRNKSLEGVLSYLIVELTDLEESEVYNNLNIVDSYESIKNILNKQNTHDLKVKIKNNTILLEMNQFNGPGTRFRNSAHYHFGIVNKIETGSNEKNIGRLYQISFDNKVPFSDDLVSRVMMMDIKTHQIDDSEKYFQKVKVNLSKIRKLRYNDVNELTRLEKILLVIMENKKEILHKLSKGDKELEIMVKEIERLSKDPDIVSYFNEQKIEEMARRMDIEAEVEEAVEKAVEKAVEEAIEENTKKVEEETTKKVTEEVTERNAIETARRMLEDKLDVATISKYTGLSKEEIEKLN